jgi:hypothetical protein
MAIFFSDFSQEPDLNVSHRPEISGLSLGEIALRVRNRSMTRPPVSVRGSDEHHENSPSEYKSHRGAPGRKGYRVQKRRRTSRDWSADSHSRNLGRRLSNLLAECPPPIHDT